MQSATRLVVPGTHISQLASEQPINIIFVVTEAVDLKSGRPLSR